MSSFADTLIQATDAAFEPTIQPEPVKEAPTPNSAFQEPWEEFEEIIDDAEEEDVEAEIFEGLGDLGTHEKTEEEIEQFAQMITGFFRVAKDFMSSFSDDLFESSLEKKIKGKAPDFEKLINVISFLDLTGQMGDVETIKKFAAELSIDPIDLLGAYRIYHKTKKKTTVGEVKEWQEGLIHTSVSRLVQSSDATMSPGMTLALVLIGFLILDGIKLGWMYFEMKKED
ncbi:MAG: hypothetical protein AAFW00_19770 [Bacteroidota bacterium]